MRQKSPFHALVYNLANFMRMLALPETIKHWSLTNLRDKLVKISARIVTHARYVIFQMAEVAAPRELFGEILRLIDGLRPRMVQVYKLARSNGSSRREECVCQQN